jgi:DNA-binding winged helix-turn-helix (wHTH) protein
MNVDGQPRRAFRPVEEKDIAMRVHNASRVPDQLTFAVDATTSEPRSASIHLLNSSTRPKEERSTRRSTRVPPARQSETAELPVDIDGLSILIRFIVQDVPPEMQSCLVSNDAYIHSLLSRALERVVDRLQGSLLRSGARSKQPLAIVELTSDEESSAWPLALPNETVLRVGPLELDLLDRTAKRGDRRIDLRPREFQLLKYMMQRSDKWLTRAMLLKDVWHYRFVPETNLVDVHMGRLRRKVDGPSEDPMIRNVRTVGFVLSAIPLPQASPSRPAERSGNLAVQ